MRRLLAALALGMAASTAAPCPAQEPAPAAAAELDPQRLELAREIVDLAYPPNRRREMLLRAVDAMVAQTRAAQANTPGPEMDPGAKLILDRFVERTRAEAERAIDQHVSALFGSYARGYARRFTAPELAERNMSSARPSCCPTRTSPRPIGTT
jgi:hypothetical protein